MKIKIVSYDEESKEADILICDKYELIAYCGFLKQKRLKQQYLLTVFLPKQIERTEASCKIEKIDDGYYAYRLVGLLSNREENISIIKIDNIELRVEDVPFDIKEGENISLNALRVDYSQFEE